MISHRIYIWIGTSALCLLLSCIKGKHIKEAEQKDLIEIATSERLWTGVAISHKGRIFLNYPRWIPVDSFAVVELSADGHLIPFPDIAWNSWKKAESSTDHFICVQSLYVDEKDNLWILDTGLDIQQGIIPGGAKLIQVDLAKNKVVRRISFDEAIVPPGSYLNDVRIETAYGYAYITDSGLGAIIAVDLKREKSGRFLSDHYSTKSQNITLTIEGQAWRYPDGSIPRINADGIALDTKAGYLYYQALTNRNLYRVKTMHFRNFSIDDSLLENQIELVGQTGPADGIAFDINGNLYLSAIEENAIKYLTPERKLKTLIRHKDLKWPDSFSISKDGFLYVTTSQIHLGASIKAPFRLFKIKL